MPNIKSQKKRVLTNARAAAGNKAVKTNLKTSLKKAQAALSGDSSANETVVARAYSVIDKAVKKGVIHKNTAKRKKSAIARKSRAAAVK